MSKQMFNVGDKVKILDTGSKEGWVYDMQTTVGSFGVIDDYDHNPEEYRVILTGGMHWWYRNDDLELVSSALTNDILDVQTCTAFLTSNGYKVTLEKL